MSAATNNLSRGGDEKPQSETSGASEAARGSESQPGALTALTPTDSTPKAIPLAEALNQGGFWGRTASSVVAGLVVTYVVGFVATTITIGARGGAGAPIDWLGMLGVLLIATVLAANVAYFAWAVLRLLPGSGAAVAGEPSRWRLGTLVVACNGAALWLAFGPGWWALVPTLATLGIAGYSVRTERPWLPSFQTLSQPLRGGWAASGLIVGLASLAISGATLGAIVKRMLGA